MDDYAAFCHMDACEAEASTSSPSPRLSIPRTFVLSFLQYPLKSPLLSQAVNLLPEEDRINALELQRRVQRGDAKVKGLTWQKWPSSASHSRFHSLFPHST
jgi:hypothetical protein